MTIQRPLRARAKSATCARYRGVASDRGWLPIRSAGTTADDGEVTCPSLEDGEELRAIILGAICLSISNHFRAHAYSKFMIPVTLPPGRAMLSTKPAPYRIAGPATGSGWFSCPQQRTHGRFRA